MCEDVWLEAEADWITDQNKFPGSVRVHVQAIIFWVSLALLWPLSHYPLALENPEVY